jgi:hypothetical protein
MQPFSRGMLVKSGQIRQSVQIFVSSSHRLAAIFFNQGGSRRRTDHWVRGSRQQRGELIVAEHHIPGRSHELDGTAERNTRHSFRRRCGPALAKVTLQDLMRAWPNHEIPGQFLRDVAEEYTDERRESGECAAGHAIERCGNPVNVRLWDVRLIRLMRLADRDLPAIIPKLVPPEGVVR